jgi:RNA polymerase sigma-70 factor (ECF subfamily)
MVMKGAGMTQDELYLRATGEFGAALKRIAAAYEADPDQRHDLLQEMHLALWRSFASFAGKCALRTWVYRVCNNVAISKRLRRRVKLRLVSLEELDEIVSGADEPELAAGQTHALARLRRMIRSLDPPDDQVMLLYLEDLDAGSIGEITGLSANAVALRIHRIKTVLARQFRQGECGG